VSLPPEILKKVRLLEIRTRKLVNSIFAGQYHSAFRGQGMTFSEFREYVAGDDVRAIAWPVTARTGRVHIKKFDEERELTVMLVVDISGSLNFGSGENVKGEVLNHLSAMIGFAAARNNDHVGLLLFTDQVEHYVPPRKGRGHIQRILRDLYYHRPKGSRTRLAPALDHLRGLLKKKAAIFIMSDFRDEGFSQSVRTMSKKHDVVAITIQDPAELTVPNLGLVDFHDAETGDVITVDTSSNLFQKTYREACAREQARVTAELKKAGVDQVDVISAGDFTAPLISYFSQRAGRRS
jgi:uncharacterized protein (DUF58 family)